MSWSIAPILCVAGSSSYFVVTTELGISVRNDVNEALGTSTPNCLVQIDVSFGHTMPDSFPLVERELVSQSRCRHIRTGVGGDVSLNTKAYR